MARQRPGRQFAETFSCCSLNSKGSRLMISFRLWAPNARQVEIRIGTDIFGMTPRGSVCGSPELRSAKAGVDYAWVLAGAEPLPDPRSPWQPNGIHGPSRTVDHGAFSWTSQWWQAKPLSAALFYDIPVGTCTS